MADEQVRIGGGGYAPATELPQEPDTAAEPAESGSGEAASPGEPSAASGQPSAPQSEAAEAKPAAASPTPAQVRHDLHIQDEGRRRLPSIAPTPRRPVSPGSQKAERQADGSGQVDGPDESEAGLFREPGKADSQEGSSGQKGQGGETAEPQLEAKSATGTGKNSPSANAAVVAPAPGSPASVARTSSPTPAATQQTSAPATNGSSPAISRPQAPVRPAPDRLKSTPDGAAGQFARERLKSLATQGNGNPKASLQPRLGTPASASKTASPVTLKQLKTGEVVPVGGNREHSLRNTAKAPEGLAPDRLRLDPDNAASQVQAARSRLQPSSNGNRRASVGTTPGSPQLPANGTGKLSSEQLKILQTRIRQGRSAVNS